MDSDSISLLSNFKRHINSLSDENIVTKKSSIKALYDLVLESRFSTTGGTFQTILLEFHKTILSLFSDKSEYIREMAIKIIQELFSRCDNMTPFLEYIIEILYIRSNCHDLEGIEGLPEVMRPPPSQKPQVLLKLVETSEEIRKQLLELLKIIISCSEDEFKYKYVNPLVGVVRAYAMDPCPEIQREANLVIAQFARENTELLHHFTVILARSTLLALVSRNSKVRMAGIEALNEILNCGVWKYNAFVFEILIGFRDPNHVPIKAFYEYTTNLNYFALLIKDPKTSVRELFIRSVGDWITRLPDKYDHHSRLIPYLLAGLFDEYPEIVETALDVLEEAGILHEREKEEELRETKQLGLDSHWTLQGKLKTLPLPSPFSTRPRLGTRLIVRSQVRKMWKALFTELRDFSVENKVKASRLILAGVVFSEDYMTQFLVIMLLFRMNSCLALCHLSIKKRFLRKKNSKLLRISKKHFA